MVRTGGRKLVAGTLAGAASLAAGSEAYADVIEKVFNFTTFATAPIPPDATSACFDIDGDGTGDFNISWVNAGSQTLRLNGDANTGDFPCPAMNLIIGGGGYPYRARRFALDQVIDASATTYSRAYIKVSNPDLDANSFAAVSQSFAGIVFHSNTDGSNHLAWLEFAFDGDGTRSGGRLVRAGWNDVPVGSPGGDSVVAGMLPEPRANAMQLMALGAVGVLAWRRQRRPPDRVPPRG